MIILLPKPMLYVNTYRTEYGDSFLRVWHQVAEFGVASHFLYKQGKNAQEGK